MQLTSMHRVWYWAELTCAFGCVQIHTSLINGRPSADDPSPKLLEFTSARYIRLRLQRIRTLNADLMTLSHRDLRDLDPIVTRRVSMGCVPHHWEGLVSGRILFFVSFWLAFCLPNHPCFTNDCHLSFVAKPCRWWPQQPFLRPSCSLLPVPIVWSPRECNDLCPKDPSLVPHPSFSNSGILIFFIWSDKSWEIFKKTYRF